jgi:hypothetical protein
MGSATARIQVARVYLAFLHIFTIFHITIITGFWWVSLSLSDSLNLLCFSVLLCSGFSKDLEDLDLSCTAPWGSIVEASDQLRDIS